MKPNTLKDQVLSAMSEHAVIVLDASGALSIGPQLGPVLEYAIEARAESLGAKGQTVEILASSQICLHADATRLRQVFVNLLTNASKFSAAGGRIWLKAT